MNSILKEELNDRPGLQRYLFCRGFLITDSAVRLEEYPFYDNWTRYDIRGYHAYVHNLQKITVYDDDKYTVFLIGHAYNPFTMEADEMAILKRIADAKDRIDYINELTGVFFLGIISERSFEMHVDASSMQAVCYGYINNHLYISSHMRLIGDLLDLKMTDYKTLIRDTYKSRDACLGTEFSGNS